jgi:translation initiation factor 4E
MAQVAPAPVDGSLASSEANNENASGLESRNGENITVFHDPENFNVKHPLMHTWTLWFTKPPSGKVRSVSDLWDNLLISDAGRQLE